MWVLLKIRKSYSFNCYNIDMNIKSLAVILISITTSGIAFGSGQYLEIEDRGHLILNLENKERIINSAKSSDNTIQCDKSKINSNSNYQEFISLEENVNFVSFLIDEPIMSFAGLKSFLLKGTKLRIELTKYSEFPEYKAPIRKFFRNEKYTNKNIFGNETYTCTDSFVKSVDVEFEKRTKTGNSVWKSSKLNESFEIKGFDKTYKIDNTSPNFAREDNFVEIDLKQFIEANPINGQIFLEIECTTCNLISEYYQKKYGINQKKIIVKTDFRLLKSQIELKRN